MAKKVKCKFCGKEVDADKMIFGKTKAANICEECLEVCNNIVADRDKDESSKELIVLKPTELKSKLDEYIVGQEQAKKIISVAVYNHYKRLFKMDKCDTEIQKSNICLVGSSGSGKTLMAKTIAKILDVPIVIADATTITITGYSGRNVEDILDALIKKADGDIKRAEQGIVFIDEVDKLVGVESTKSTRDVTGVGVQQAFLKMIEGTTVYIEGNRHPFVEDKVTAIDTTNILFIASGSFNGIEKLLKTKKDKKQIGFGAENYRVSEAEKERLIENVTQEDLIKFGMIPEFVGRLQTIAVMHKLDENAMMKILEEPKDSLVKQYKELMRIDGIELDFEKEALSKIAKIAVKQKTGARSLKSILDNTMIDIMYSAPTSKQKKVVIKESDVKSEHM